MKSVYTILLFMLAFSLKSQSQLKIDQLEKFQQFTFDSSSDQYSGKFKLDLTISYGLKYYKYDGRDINDIYGMAVGEINLGFRDDKLEYMDFYFKRMKSEEFDLLQARLSQTFGRGQSLPNPAEKGVVQAVEWKGNRVLAQLYRYDNSANDSHDNNKTVLMITNSTQ